jgi:hypothetical protein
MYLRTFAALAVFALGGCPQDTDPSTDDTETDDSDTDGEPDDTDPGPDDTDGFDTDTDNIFETGWGDTGIQETGRSDSGGRPQDSNFVPPTDTSECSFGERLDCNDTCFPAYFVGDGHCDDGTDGPADFDCITFSRDNGDCAVDTAVIDTDIPPGSCPIVFRTNTGNNGNAMAWEIRSLDGTVWADHDNGDFPLNNSSYVENVFLPTGSYGFVAQSNTNGWLGGKVTGTSPIGTLLIEALLLAGSEDIIPFEVDCDEDTDVDEPDLTECGDLVITVNTALDAPDMAWRLKEADGTTVAESFYRAYLDFQNYTSEIELPTGQYIFNMRDLAGDGWNGSTYSIFDKGLQQTISSGTMSNGYTLDQVFYVDCSDTFEPAPIPVPGDVSCQPLGLRVFTDLFGDQVGWEIQDATGAVIDTAPTGTYSRNAVFSTRLLIAEGAWTLNMLDAGGDGWGGTRLEVFDFTTGYIFGTFGDTFTAGAARAESLTTEGPAYTPVPPPPGGGVCAGGTTEDCDGVCWPRTMLGDGFCDDGTLFAPNFDCVAFNNDRGDCPVGP